ncbi:V-type ATP synthase subunit K [bacterium]|nr:V-type ATP synthase subunit K [bacterium]|tara:strand:- start:5564 stop:6049 length:486 start_codon:yes stop_codon:yes gene_type:complete
MAIGIGTFLAVLGAAVALGVPGVCSAIGLRAAGVAGAGAVAENKENFKNALVLQSLPQTQTIYGFITALFIIMGAGLLGATGQEVSLAQGLVMLAAGSIVAITGISAIFQGLVASAGIASSAKNQDAFVPSIVFTGQVETPAIFGFIAALIVLVVGLNVLG